MSHFIRFFFSIFFLGFVFLSFSSCGSKEVEEEISEILELSSLTEFSAYQETKSLSITSNMYWFTETNDFLLLYAQGIQYAKGRITVETAIQFPLVQTISEEEKRDYSLFLGTRFVF